MMENIIINTVVPMLFAYGLQHNEEKYKDKALHWLEEVAAENNSIIKSFVQLGLKIESAYDSQALLQLKNEYCSPKKCLECSVGNNLLKREAFNAITASDLPF